MNIAAWLVFGLIIGVIANFFSKRPSRENLMGTVLLGVLGSVLGGLMGNLLFQEKVTFSLSSFMAAAGFGLVLIIADRVFSER